MDRYQKRTGSILKAGPFAGGVITYVDRASIPFGGFSTLQNFRRFHPGMRKRKGMSRLGPSANAGPLNPVIVYPQYNNELENPSGYIERKNTDALWATCRNNTSGTAAYNNDTSDNDQCFVEEDGGYDIGRTLLFFNTSRVVVDGTLVSARLALKMADTNTTCNICAAQGNFGMLFNTDDSFTAAAFNNMTGWPSTPILLAGPTATEAAGNEIYLNFTAAGLSYLTGKLGPYTDGQGVELFVMEYDHDFLDVAPGSGELYRAEFYIPNLNYEWNPTDLSDWPRLELYFDYGVEPLSIYQFRKNLVDEKHTYLQLPNGEIAEALSDPPAYPSVSATNPTGQFTTHFSGWNAPLHAPDFNTFNDDPQPILESSTDIDRMIPASWSVIGDLMLYSDNTGQHKIFPGDEGRIIGAWINTTATANYGTDVWEDIVEASSAFGAMANVQSTDQGLIIQTPIMAHKFNFEMRTAESNNLTIEVARLDGDTWDTVAAGDVTDGTRTTGTFKIDGTIEIPPDENQKPGYLFGTTGYFYRFRPSAGTFASANIDKVSYGSDYFPDMENVWDGIPRDVVEVRHYVATEDAHYTYPAGSVNLSDLVHTNDKVIVGTARHSKAIYVDVGSTPNQTSTTTISDVEYWDGTAWQSVNSYTDGTNGFRNSGWLTFALDAFGITEAEKHVYENSQYSIYWWRITFGVASFSDNVRVAMTYKPDYDIDDLGEYGICNAVWKDRAIWVFKKNPNYLYVSATDRPNVLNGTDSAILRAGDGRTNDIKCVKKFHNELMVWQEEKGPDGGTLTLFEGYSPATFGRLVLSYNVGTLNANSVVVIDGSFGATRSDDYVQTLAFFISHYGVYLTDGRIVKRISGPIQNYFDSRFSENLRSGYEDKCWIAHDKTANVLRLGIVSGSSATRCNIFPVYDLASGEWSFDDFYDDSKAPSHFLAIESGSGQDAFIEVSPSQGDGGVYLNNTGLNDGGDAIEADMRIEFNADGHMLEFREAIVRFLTDTDSENIVFNVYRNGIEQTDEAETITQDPVTATEPMKRHRYIKGVYQDSNISIRFRNLQSDADLYLYDYIWDVDVLEKR